MKSIVYLEINQMRTSHMYSVSHLPFQLLFNELCI